jgi:Fe-S oxidoreductase
VEAGPGRVHLAARTQNGGPRKVGLFITCFNDTLFPQVGRATVAVLERLSVEVDFPPAQTCCGQMHFNSGYRPECMPVVRRYGEAFARYDAIVTPSASCASMVRRYHPLLDPTVARQTPTTYELCEFLVDVLGVTDVGAAFPHTVAFHPTSHSRRLLHIGDRPERLPDGPEILVHCPDRYNVLEIEDLESGQRLTDGERVRRMCSTRGWP